jgi:hypothetical protein
VPAGRVDAGWIPSSVEGGRTLVSLSAEDRFSTGVVSRVLELVVDPAFDVAASVAQVSADPESRWTLAAVSPGVDGGDGHLEEVGEILCGEQGFEGVHTAIVRIDPFISLSFGVQTVTISELDLVLRQRAATRWNRDGSASAVAVDRVVDRVTATLLKG